MFSDLVHKSQISRVNKGEEGLLFNLDGNEYNSTSREMFFQDGKRRIDYVLVYRDGEMADTIKSKRYAFLAALAEQMIEIEVENCRGEILARTGPQGAGFKDYAAFTLEHMESSHGALDPDWEYNSDDDTNPLEAAIRAHQDLVFVKLHATWSTLIRVAEVLQFRKPLKQAIAKSAGTVNSKYIIIATPLCYAVIASAHVSKSHKDLPLYKISELHELTIVQDTRLTETLLTLSGSQIKFSKISFNHLMAYTTITNDMKKHAVTQIVSIKAKQSNLEIARFLKVATSFVCKVRKELNENNGDELATTSKRKPHCQRSANSLRKPEFVRRVHGMIEENPGKVDAVAYIETLQTIVMPPWIDGVPNGGRPYFFQLDSAPSHKALKTQDWMAENFQHHVKVERLELQEGVKCSSCFELDQKNIFKLPAPYRAPFTRARMSLILTQHWIHYYITQLPNHKTSEWKNEYALETPLRLRVETTRHRPREYLNGSIRASLSLLTLEYNEAGNSATRMALTDPRFQLREEIYTDDQKLIYK
ncbi:hypothetical protein ACTXT7_005275 [Hymenolepis weldensis]